MILQFGAGDVFAQAITNAFGEAVPLATPIRIAGLQEFSLDIQTELKEFHGQGRFAIATAQGKSKVGGKMKGALINGLALNTIVFGTEYATGTMKSVYADSTGQEIPTATAYTIKVTAPNSGTLTDDLGVIGADGLAYIKVASAPKTGQYSVSGDTYTFAEADKGKRVYISYAYTYALDAAKRIDLTNLTMGNNATFKLLYLTNYNGKKTLIELESVTSGKLGLYGSKNDDFSIPEIDFSASTDAAGYKLGTLWVME
ncbi:MAG: hypothetical protein Q4G42_05185 [Neisseria sp.]|nr:hypothetical protein [Neisseria sp.]